MDLHLLYNVGLELDYLVKEHKQKDANKKSPRRPFILVTGPSGSGKSLLINQICKNNEINCVTIDPAIIFLQGGQRTAAIAVNEIIMKASLKHKNVSPFVVHFERCHELISQKYADDSLVYLVSSWIQNGTVLFIGTSTKFEESLHPLWSDGANLFFKIDPVLTFDQRVGFLKFFDLSFSHENLSFAALVSGGFSVADLNRLCSMLTIKNQPIQSQKKFEEIVVDSCAEIRLGISNRKIIANDLELTSWSDIYGQKDTKKRLLEYSRLLHDSGLRKLYKDRNVTWPHGVLLYGPPGTGKTKMARALAVSAKAHFISLSINHIVHAEIGASEHSLKQAFEEAKKLQPSIIFIDELDALVRGEKGSVTERVALQLINEMDLLKDQLVLVLGATNLVENVSKRLLSYDRFGMQIFVGPLEPVDCAEMIQSELQKVGKEMSFKRLISVLNNRRLTGAQVIQIVDEYKQSLLNEYISLKADEMSLSDDRFVELLEDQFKSLYINE